ncbi:MAG TPA: hypothetical protein VF981_07960 [Gemmatimonadaceae bacterium]
MKLWESGVVAAAVVAIAACSTEIDGGLPSYRAATNVVTHVTRDAKGKEKSSKAIGALGNRNRSVSLSAESDGRATLYLSSKEGTSRAFAFVSAQRIRDWVPSVLRFMENVPTASAGTSIDEAAPTLRDDYTMGDAILIRRSLKPDTPPRYSIDIVGSSVAYGLQIVNFWNVPQDTLRAFIAGIAEAADSASALAGGVRRNR